MDLLLDVSLPQDAVDDVLSLGSFVSFQGSHQGITLNVLELGTQRENEQSGDKENL